MANAATAYRDMGGSGLADRGGPGADAGSFAAMLVYLDAPPPQQMQQLQPPPRQQPPPLPPLDAVRQISSQHGASLPPVRNLLTQPQPQQWAASAPTNLQMAPQNGIQIPDFEGEFGTMTGGFQAPLPADKPLKRGPKGPRQKVVRIPPPLKPLAPKVPEAPETQKPAAVGVKPKKSPVKRPRRPKKEKLPPLDTSVSDESVASSLLTMNTSTDLGLSQPFNELQSMEPALLSHQHSQFPMQPSPMDLHPSQTQQAMMSSIYNSPQNNFSPVSETANPPTYTQQSMYHSPAYLPTSRTSNHVSPHSTISPLQSIHNSPHAFRAALDHIPELGSPRHLSLTSPAQMFPQRLGTGTSNSPNFVGVNGGFPGMDTVMMNGAATGKRKRGFDKDVDKGSGKGRKGGMTAIQSVLNHDDTGRVDLTPPMEQQGYTLQQPTSHPRSLSPKHGRISLPITPTSPTSIRAPNDLNALQLLLPRGMSPTTMNESYAETITDEEPRPFELHNPNPLAMVLNSDHGSTPQLYDFPALDSANAQQGDLPPRDVSTRLPVQSLLLPPLPVSAHSPSMQVMQIQPSLLDQPPDLQDLQQSSHGADPFDMRMDSAQPQFDVGGNMQPSWADILLQPNSATNFQTTLTNPSADSTLFEQPVPQIEQPPTRFDPQEPTQFDPPPPRRPKKKQRTPLPKPPPKPAEPSEGKRKKRGKHARYVAAEGQNGEPDKTHIDVLVTVIQKTDGPKIMGRHYDPPPQPPPESPPHGARALPSIETLQLGEAENRQMQSEGYDYLDFLGSEEWLMQSNGPPVGMNQVRYYPPTDFATSAPQPVPLAEVRKPEPPPPPPVARRGRKGSRVGAKKVKAEETKAWSYSCMCPSCGAKFQHYQHLKTHLASHQATKPFKCPFDGCEQTFSQKGNLKAHLRKHTGEKPFICEECDKAFAQKGNLQTHKSVHTGSKPFVCFIDNCASRYSQRGNLKMHQNKFHTERIQELTQKLQDAARGGPALTEDEKQVADHLKILYKYSNKGIKGRGKKVPKRAPPSPTPPPPEVESPAPAPPKTRIDPAPEQTFSGGGSLLPLPVTKPVPLRGIEGPSPFMGMQSWPRDVFIGNQAEHQSGGGPQPSYLGIPGDTGPSSLNNFAFMG